MNYKVILTDVGVNKIHAIKNIRQIGNLSLKEAKEIAGNLNTVIKEGITLDEAKSISETFEAIGAKVKIIGYVSQVSDSYVNNIPIDSDMNTYKLVLKIIGPNKIKVVKEIRQLTGLTLKETVDMIDSLPSEIKSNLTYNEAIKIAKRFEEVGANVKVEKESAFESYNNSRECEFDEEFLDTAINMISNEVDENNHNTRSVSNESINEVENLQNKKGLFSFIKNLFID